MSDNLHDQIQSFLEYLEIEKNCSKLTIRDYRHYLEVFENWFGSILPNKSLKSLDLQIIRRYRVFLANRIDSKGLTLKRVTQNYYVIALRSFLRFLIKNDYQTLEPSKIDLPKIEQRDLRFLEREHVERLLINTDTAKTDGIRDRAILELLFSTGLRVSELVSLNRDKINLEKKEFGIVGKGGKSRIVFVSQRAADWLKKYLSKREDQFRPLFIRYSGKVDGQNNGEKMRLTARSVERLVKKYVRKSRIPLDASPHSLRHAFATDLLINGADIRSIQEMLGHKNISTTQIYTHFTNKKLKEVHEAFHSGNK